MYKYLDCYIKLLDFMIVSHIKVDAPRIPDTYEISFTGHCIQRLNDRKISIDEVKQVIKEPEETTINENGTFTNTSKLNGKISVVFKIDDNKVLVITAMKGKNDTHRNYNSKLRT
jgi:hypothetical protein